MEHFFGCAKFNKPLTELVRRKFEELRNFSTLGITGLPAGDCNDFTLHANRDLLLYKDTFFRDFTWLEFIVDWFKKEGYECEGRFFIVTYDHKYADATIKNSVISVTNSLTWKPMPESARCKKRKKPQAASKRTKRGKNTQQPAAEVPDDGLDEDERMWRRNYHNSVNYGEVEAWYIEHCFDGQRPPSDYSSVLGSEEEARLAGDATCDLFHGTGYYGREPKLAADLCEWVKNGDHGACEEKARAKKGGKKQAEKLDGESLLQAASALPPPNVRNERMSYVKYLLRECGTGSPLLAPAFERLKTVLRVLGSEITGCTAIFTRQLSKLGNVHEAMECFPKLQSVCTHDVINSSLQKFGAMMSDADVTFQRIYITSANERTISPLGADEELSGQGVVEFISSLPQPQQVALTHLLVHGISNMQPEQVYRIGTLCPNLTYLLLEGDWHALRFIEGEETDGEVARHNTTSDFDWFGKLSALPVANKLQTLHVDCPTARVPNKQLEQFMKDAQCFPALHDASFMAVSYEGEQGRTLVGAFDDMHVMRPHLVLLLRNTKIAYL